MNGGEYKNDVKKHGIIENLPAQAHSGRGRNFCIPYTYIKGFEDLPDGIVKSGVPTRKGPGEILR